MDTQTPSAPARAVRPGASRWHALLPVLVLSILATLVPGVAAAGPVSDRLGVVLTARFDAGERSGVVPAVVSPPSFSANAASVPTLPVTFTAGCTDDAPCEEDVEVSWDFGDGGTSEGSDLRVAHAYTSPGSYTARVRVSTASGVGQGEIRVLVSPRWADADADLQSKPGRVDRESIWAVSALGLLPSCRVAFPYLDPGVDPASTDVNRGLFCPRPTTTYSPPLALDPVTGLLPDIMPRGASANGITGVPCTASWDACGLPVGEFARDGNPRSECASACRDSLVAADLLRPDLRLTYDPTNCLDGWTARRANSTWSIAPGVEPGCVTRGEFFRAVVTTFDGEDSSDQRLADPSFCRGNPSSALGSTQMRRAHALGLPVTRSRGGAPVCDTEAAVTKAEAYLVLARTTGLPPSCPASLRDLADATLGHGTPSAHPSCAELGAVLGAGGPLVGDSSCADGVGACFRPEEPLTRSDLARLLSGLVVGLPTLASGLEVSLATDASSVPVGRPVRLNLSARVPASYAPGEELEVTWPSTSEGLSELGCDPVLTLVVGDDRKASASCTYVRTRPGSSALVALVTDQSGNSSSATAVVAATNSAPRLDVVPFPATAEEGTAEVLVPVVDPEGAGLAFSVRSAAGTGTWAERTEVEVGTVSVSAAPGGALLSFQGAPDAHGPYSVSLQACDGSTCTSEVVSGEVSPANDAPRTPALVTTSGSGGDVLVLTLGGSDPADSPDGSSELGLYELSRIPSSGTLTYDADPGDGEEYIPAVPGSTTDNPVLRYVPDPSGRGLHTVSYRVQDAGPAPLWSAPGSAVLLVS